MGNLRAPSFCVDSRLRGSPLLKFLGWLATVARSIHASDEKQTAFPGLR